MPSSSGDVSPQNKFGAWSLNSCSPQEGCKHHSVEVQVHCKSDSSLIFLFPSPFYLQGQETEGGKIIHPLVHFPNGGSSRGWAMLNPGSGTPAVWPQ